MTQALKANWDASRVRSSVRSRAKPSGPLRFSRAVQAEELALLAAVHLEMTGCCFSLREARAHMRERGFPLKRASGPLAAKPLTGKPIKRKWTRPNIEGRSGCRGVAYHGGSLKNPWRAQIGLRHPTPRCIYVGIFPTREAACKAVRAARLKHLGPEAVEWCACASGTKKKGR